MLFQNSATVQICSPSISSKLSYEITNPQAPAPVTSHGSNGYPFTDTQEFYYTHRHAVILFSLQRVEAALSGASLDCWLSVRASGFNSFQNHGRIHLQSTWTCAVMPIPQIIKRRTFSGNLVKLNLQRTDSSVAPIDSVDRMNRRLHRGCLCRSWTIGTDLLAGSCV